MGDNTRFTFKARKNYSQVLKQQGRVALDADWNEQAEIESYRWRAETLDLEGRCWVSPETPDAFLIEAAGPGALTIGRGRMYVDGLLAESHGAGAQEFDDSLDLLRGTEPVPYDEQPHHQPEDLEPEAGATELIYLDVWQREVTAIEDPEIREIALGGPDTATRLHTVWQVRSLGPVRAEGCEDELDEWDALVRPSAGRLTTSAVAPPASEDPCIISPSGGYRGVENRLYRVEIHVGGGMDDARFKWSRYNASIVSAVEAIDSDGTSSRLRVSSLGRDRELRFSVDQWVEVLDDRRELEHGAGHMARVTEVDEANRVLTVEPAIPALFDFDPEDEARHTRVRRWDQGEAGDETTGLVEVGAGPIPLELGVQVSFGLAEDDGEFKVGDTWSFAARTADGSVEELVEAPPRAVHHHYCRLALVHWDDPEEEPEVTDCRPAEEEGEECCCTVVVRPGESIQAAVDSLPARGGCVCLKPGVHRIRRPIRIRSSNVTLHGETRGALIRRRNGISVVEVGSPAGQILRNVVVETIEMAVGRRRAAFDRDETFMVTFERCAGSTLRNCGLRVAAGGNSPNLPAVAAGGVEIEDGEGVAVEGNRLQRLMLGVLVRESTGTSVVENELLGPSRDAVDAAGVTASHSAGDLGVWIGAAGTGHRVERNRIDHYRIGVSLGERRESAAVPFMAVPVFAFELVADLRAAPGGGESSIVGNRIHREGRLPNNDPPVYGIDVAAARCLVRDNRLNLADETYGGIRASEPHARVEGNELTSTAPAGAGEFPVGVFIGQVDGESPASPPDFGRVAGNLMSGPQSAVVVTGTEAAEVDCVHVLGNRVDTVAEIPQPVAITLERASHAVVEGNEIVGAGQGAVLADGFANRLSGNEMRDGFAGIFANGEQALVVSGNSVDNMRRLGVGGLALVGTADVTGCRITNCSWEGLNENGAVGLGVIQVFGGLVIDGCEVLNTGVARGEDPAISQPAFGIWAQLVLSAQITRNAVVTAPGAPGRDPSQGDRALSLTGWPAVRYLTGNIEILLAFGSAQISDNNFSGPGAPSLVDVGLMLPVTESMAFGFTFEKTIFSNNVTEHFPSQAPPTNIGPATINFGIVHAIVEGNHVKANLGGLPLPGYAAMNFNSQGRIVLLGNMTTGPFVHLGSVTPANPANFNVLL